MLCRVADGEELNSRYEELFRNDHQPGRAFRANPRRHAVFGRVRRHSDVDASETCVRRTPVKRVEWMGIEGDATRHRGDQSARCKSWSRKESSAANRAASKSTTAHDKLEDIPRKPRLFCGEIFAARPAGLPDSARSDGAIAELQLAWKRIPPIGKPPSSTFNVTARDGVIRTKTISRRN